MSDQLKYQIYINRVPISGAPSSDFSVSASSVSGVGIGYAILNSDKVIRDYYDKDFYVNVPLYRNFKIEEYVDTQKDSGVSVMDRQEFNPYFLEFGFFDTIQRNVVNAGNDLTQEQIAYIISVRPDLDPSTNIPSWFDSIGRDTLPWGSITIENIDSVIQNTENIISKAAIFPIDINS